MEKLKAFGEQPEKKTKAYGIDLGTTNSCISVVEDNGNTRIIELDSEGHVTLPSCVLWDSDTNEFIVGREAYKHRADSNVCYSVKRKMGTDQTVTFKHKGKVIKKSPVEVSAIILKDLVKRAKLYKDIHDVVITVPAGFNTKQIADTKAAGELAGLNVLNIMKEPTAASLVYRLDSKPGNVLVYDLGGGTFDVSIVSIQKAVKNEGNDLFDMLGIEGSNDDETKDSVTVRATRGNTHLGGDDLDVLIYKRLMDKLKEKGLNPDAVTKEDRENIILRVEQYKKNENFRAVEMKIDLKLKDETVFKDVVSLTRADIYECTKVIFKKTQKYIDDVLKGSSLNIDRIVLVGGSTKNEYLREMIKEAYPDCEIYHYINPDESVARGASINAKRVKYGSEDLEVFDVIAEPIGVVAGGIVTPLIPKNQSIPCSVQRLFATSEDNQETVSVDVYEGSSIYKTEDLYLGSVVVEGIPKRKAGTVGVRVTLTVDTDGMLSCKSAISGDGMGIDEITKEAKLVNLLGQHNKEKEKGLGIRFERWYKYADSLPESKSKKLRVLIDESIKDESKTAEVVRLMREFKNEESK